MAIWIDSLYSPCPIHFLLWAQCALLGQWGTEFPSKCSFWNGGSSRSQKPACHLFLISAAVNKTNRESWAVLWLLSTGHSRKAQDAGNTSSPHLQSSLKLFPSVFFSLANGRSPRAGFRQVIYVFSSRNKWHCPKAGQMEEHPSINLFASLKSVVK